MKNPPSNVELKHKKGHKLIVFGRKPKPMADPTRPFVGVHEGHVGLWFSNHFSEDEIIGLWEDPHKPCPHCCSDKQHIIHPTYNTSVVECLGCGARGAGLKCPPNVAGGDQAAWDAWNKRGDA